MSQFSPIVFESSVVDEKRLETCMIPIMRVVD